MADLFSARQIITEAELQFVSNLERQNILMCAERQDVHTHTRPLGANCKTFIELDNRYNLTASIAPAGQTFATVRAAIEALLVTQKVIGLIGDEGVINVRWVLDRISANGTNPVAETDLNLQDQLLRTWHLAGHVDRTAPEHKIFMLDPTDPTETREIQVSSLEAVVLNLTHNRLVIDSIQGGCLPGISGRLILPYCAFVVTLLRKQREQALLAGFMPSQAPLQRHLDQPELTLPITEELALQEAIAISRLAAEQSVQASEQQQIQQAIEASRAASVAASRAPAVDPINDVIEASIKAEEARQLRLVARQEQEEVEARAAIAASDPINAVIEASRKEAEQIRFLNETRMKEAMQAQAATRQTGRPAMRPSLAVAVDPDAELQRAIAASLNPSSELSEEEQLQAALALSLSISSPRRPS